MGTTRIATIATAMITTAMTIATGATIATIAVAEASPEATARLAIARFFEVGVTLQAVFVEIQETA